MMWKTKKSELSLLIGLGVVVGASIMGLIASAGSASQITTISSLLILLGAAGTMLAVLLEIRRRGCDAIEERDEERNGTANKDATAR